MAQCLKPGEANMKHLVVLAGVLVLGCSEATAPEVDCQGELEVLINVHRMYADTTVACVFPRDTMPPEPPEPPCDDDDEGHHDHHHHDHRGHK